MKHVLSFVDIEDQWEIDHLRASLGDASRITMHKETADLLLDELKETTVLSTFINSKVNKKVIVSI